MASPPPYSGSGPNPRELPPGWTSQWDSNYNAWFYVNTRENPPRSSWVHPYATAPSRSPPPQQFAPAMGAPPNREFNRSPYGEYNQGGWQNQPPQQYGGGPPGGYGTGYQPSYGGPPGGGYGGPQGEYRGNPGGYGGPMGGYPQEQERGFFGGGQSRPTYQQQPPAPPKKSGPGMGTALLEVALDSLEALSLWMHSKIIMKMSGKKATIKASKMAQTIMEEEAMTIMAVTTGKAAKHNLT
ncbi:hypothetical protein SERLADRAFT_459998 [Serpula lacrymans var. lacrymans S7.9]|uniref:WW domain-containing protein n=1 Tax=Serpula lacrymans var. lacrymans (strain S7.9) TaxID=578457 RepID=F8NP43_SERL9|nr:uncharacterized protein SERLADRAFT_459998 [Serpula lacrymans var. lacrymans S7.9]EGO27128.1 hypothetical protein SERLADRAFT_459998 [Serpula lacrymans var. lacrymans S7.9]